jgi:hypothetical protein
MMTMEFILTTLRVPVTTLGIQWLIHPGKCAPLATELWHIRYRTTESVDSVLSFHIQPLSLQWYHRRKFHVYNGVKCLRIQKLKNKTHLISPQQKDREKPKYTFACMTLLRSQVTGSFAQRDVCVCVCLCVCVMSQVHLQYLSTQILSGNVLEATHFMSDTET